MFIELKPTITKETKSRLTSCGVSSNSDDLMKLFREYSEEKISVTDKKQVESLRNFKVKNSPGAEKISVGGYMEKKFTSKIETLARYANVSLDVFASWAITRFLEDNYKGERLNNSNNNQKDNSKLKHNEEADRYFGR